VEFGKYWEQSYLIEWESQKEGPLIDFADCGGPVRQKVWSKLTEPVKHITVADKTFMECDIRANLDSCTFTRCNFKRCRFVTNKWARVKFSGCDFSQCHFLRLNCEDCEFVDDCTFKDLSASAEYLKLFRTELPASKFVRALNPNIRNLPASKSLLKQRKRFADTKRKIAGLVLRSVTDCGDPFNIMAAHREVVLSILLSRIKAHDTYYDDASRELKESNRCWRLLCSFWPSCEYIITCVSGWLTDWGRSLLRSTVYIIVTVALFAAIYCANDPNVNRHNCYDVVAHSILKSLEISLLFGYTTHRQLDTSFGAASLIFLNAITGLYWYSLIIAAITKRTLQ
jgi:hypothetical protein